MEGRLSELTDELIRTQAEVEALASEKATLIFRTEAAQEALRSRLQEVRSSSARRLHRRRSGAACRRYAHLPHGGRTGGAQEPPAGGTHGGRTGGAQEPPAGGTLRDTALTYSKLQEGVICYGTVRYGKVWRPRRPAVSKVRRSILWVNTGEGITIIMFGYSTGISG
eukprot:1194908-Prorocentrum_minimum.AAC.5